MAAVYKNLTDIIKPIVIMCKNNNGIRIQIINGKKYYAKTIPEFHLNELKNIISVVGGEECTVITCPNAVYNIPRIASEKVKLATMRISEKMKQNSQENIDLREIYNYVYHADPRENMSTYIFTFPITICSFKITAFCEVFKTNNDKFIITPVTSTNKPPEIKKIEYGNDGEIFQSVGVNNCCTDHPIRARFVRLLSDDGLLPCYGEVIFYSYRI